MIQIHTLNKQGKPIYPVTHISAVVDDNGNTVEELIQMEVSNINNRVSTNESKIINLQSNLTAVNNQIVLLQSQIGNINEILETI